MFISIPILIMIALAVGVIIQSQKHSSEWDRLEAARKIRESLAYSQANPQGKKEKPSSVQVEPNFKNQPKKDRVQVQIERSELPLVKKEDIVKRLEKSIDKLWDSNDSLNIDESLELKRMLNQIKAGEDSGFSTTNYYWNSEHYERLKDDESYNWYKFPSN